MSTPRWAAGLAQLKGGTLNTSLAELGKDPDTARMARLLAAAQGIVALDVGLRRGGQRQGVS